MLDILGNIFSAVLSGGATGLLGVAFQRFFDYKNKQLDITAAKDRMAHEALLRDKDAAIMDKEWAGRLQVAQAEGEAAKDVEESKAFGASYGMEPSRYSDQSKLTAGQGWIMVILDAVRGVVRPGLTIYLCVLTTFIYWQLRDIMDTKTLWTQESAAKAMEMIINTVLYLTTTCVLWWFGTRNKVKPKT